MLPSLPRRFPFVASLLFLAAAIAAATMLDARASSARAAGYVLVDPPRALAPIDLVAGGGVKVDSAALAGRWSFLAIGYTHCPDICPMVLTNLAAVTAEMKKTVPAAALPRVVFVSVDPGRDAPDYLRDYVAHFGEDVVGATGAKAALDRLVDSLGAVYRLGRAGRDGFYTVDHSAEIYLIDPKLRLRARFRPPIAPARTVRDFLAISGVAAPRAVVAGP
jgi:protein SCO1/2